MVMMMAVLWFLMTTAPIHGENPATVDVRSIEDLVERHTLAMGGREKLEALESVWRRRGERAVVIRKKPHFLMVVIPGETGGIRYAEGFDGTIAWEEIDDGGRRPVEGRPLEALRHTTQWPGNLNPLYRARENGHRLELLGTETIDGSVYHKVLMTLGDGFEREYLIHSESFHIERSRDTRRHHAYQETIRRIETVWSDFREVEGYLFPFREMEVDLETGEILSDGGPTEIRVNVRVPDEDFGLEGGYGRTLEPSLHVRRPDVE